MSGFKELADTLARRFMAEGFTVHRYDAYSTDSVYLKLDYGLGNSIRISDHRGYKHLKYRFNIGTWVRRRRDEYDGGYARSYYPVEDVESLVADVLRNRHQRRQSLGRRGYERKVSELRGRSRHIRKGFWSHCHRAK